MDMPEATAPSASPRRSAYRETARQRAESVPCTSMFRQLINTVEALRTRQEHAERLIRLAERRPFSADLPLPPAAVNNREASPSTPQAAPDAITSAATFPAPQENPDLTDGCSQPFGPASVPLPQKSDTEVEFMDTSSSRKRPRPTESTSDDEGSSRKVPAVTPAPESGTPPPVEASAVLHDADDGFQTVQSKSQKRRQRAAAAAGITARCVPPSGSTHCGPSTPAAAPPAVVTTTPTSVSTRASPHQCGITVLFRPAIPGATFPRTSRLSLAQALSALPGVQEVRVNTKKNVVAADAITPNWRDRLLATTELAGIPVNARMPADRTQSSGIVQGIIGNYTEEELLAGVQSAVPVLAAKRQGTALILRFAASTPPAQVRLFRMVHAVRACRPRPLQCLRCGSYGHTTATCNRTQRCLRCGGGPHGDSTCTSKAKCLHCGRAHTADSPDCQLWQRERRLATIKATAPSFLTHREAAGAPLETATSAITKVQASRAFSAFLTFRRISDVVVLRSAFEECVSDRQCHRAHLLMLGSGRRAQQRRQQLKIDHEYLRHSRYLVFVGYSADCGAIEFSMCDISARMHCLAERRSKIGQTVTGKYANAMRVSNSIAAATARPTFFRFISFEGAPPRAPRPSTAGLGLVRSGGRPAPLRHGAAVLRSRQRPDAELSRLVRKTASTTVRQLHCEISDEVRSSADTMDQSSSIPQRTCAKRPNDATGDETPAPVAASGVASDVASKRPRQMRDAAIEAHSPGSPTPSYKVIIKPRSCFDMSTLPNRAIQAAVDACLNTSRFQGFALHKPTNTISLWVHSLELVEKLKTLREIRTSQDDVLPVQAYLASGTDLRRYVVYGVDCNEEPENLRQELSCPTHKVIAARYLGRGRTCLVTLQGPASPPDRLLYYGCVLRPRPFKPSVIYCYSCYRQGHMKSSCPCPAKDDTMEATPSLSFQCGLCQTNDHDITSPQCPTKRAATKKARRRRDRRSAKPSLQEASNEVATSNRYALLASMDEDTALPTNVPPKQGTPSYSAAAKASHPKPRPSQPIPQDDPPDASCEETDIDLRLAKLQMEIQRLEERRAQIRRRRQSSELQPSPPATQMTHPPNQVPASAPVSPRELLIFVAQQLQQLTSVLVAKLQL
ncbi:hypothetical protein HPB50_025535 [Hyalomma asiaticum]|uniref:Uncharacterized protein n=1 Tax=Hyalomma asiaticum TaxID=266040 RepID=A0ACB7STK8_HYAAI|nr:hypothetical protein HPB50_025535 [Hyalomma asiaticum]